MILIGNRRGDSPILRQKGCGTEPPLVHTLQLVHPRTRDLWRAYTIMQHSQKGLVAQFLMCIAVLSWSACLQAADCLLGWDAVSPTPTGYRIYHRTATGSYGSAVDVGNNTTGSVTGLDAAVKYYFIVKAYNSAGESNPSNAVDNLVLSAVSTSSIASNSAKISWVTDEAGDSQVVYGTTTAYGSSSTLATSLVTTHSVTLSGLNPATLYHYRVKSKGTLGNGTLTNDFTFTTAPDTTAPAISGVLSSVIAYNAATIRWTTNEASDTQVEYGTTTSYGSSTVLNTTKVTSHSVSLSGLNASTTYHYRVKSKDAAGNLATSGDYTLATTSMPAGNSPFLQVNSGGSAAGTFGADRFYSGGSVDSVTNSITTSGVTNPAPGAVYQSERSGTFTYTFPTLAPGAAFTVRLHFAELHYSATGQRNFNVTLNGTRVLTNFDVFAAAGAEYKAVVRQFPATVNSNGQIVIQFLAGSVGVPMVSGIELYAPPVPLIVAVNAGGSATGSYKADSYYTGGGMTSFSNSIDTSGVINPAPSAVYQSERSGNSFSYTIPGLTANASYALRLHFAENYWTASGNRLFNVSVNGTKVLSNLDVYAAAGGPHRALVRRFAATANSNGQLVIAFSQGSADIPMASGIEVLAPTPAVVNAVNSGGGAVGSFKADSYYNGGIASSTSAVIDTTGVSNPAPQSVYQTKRFQDTTYTIPNLAPGVAYLVRLHFAETYLSTAGMRQFDVVINGVTVLNDFDIVAAAGAKDKAVVKQFVVFANSNGQIIIQYLTGSASTPQSNGIEILK